MSAAGLRNFTLLSSNIDRDEDAAVAQTGERGDEDQRHEGSTSSSNVSHIVLPEGDSVRPRHGVWSVELAMGYPWTVRSPVNYSGSVILHFTDTKDSGTVMAFPVRDVAFHNSAPSTDDSEDSDSGDSDSGDSGSSGSGGGDGDGVSEDRKGNTPADGPDTINRFSDGGTPYQIVNPVVWFFLAFILILIFASTIFLISRLMSYKFRNSSSDEGSRLITVEISDSIAHTRGRGIYGDAVEMYPQRAEESSLVLLPLRQYGSVDA